MKQDAGSTRRRPGASLLYLEPLEDRQLLSGINPLTVAWAPLPPQPGTAVVSTVVPINTPEADRQPALVSSEGVSGPTAAPYRATNPISNAPGNAAPYPNDSTQQTDTATPGTTDSSEAYPPSGSASAAPYTATPGKSDSYSQSQASTADPALDDDEGAAYGAAGQSEGGAYAANGQQAQGATPAVQVGPVLSAGSSAQQTDTVTQGTTDSSEAYPPSGSASAATAPPYPATSGKSNSYSQSQASTAYSTSSEYQGAAYGAAGQSQYDSQAGAANQTYEDSTYAVYGQQGLGVTPAVQSAVVPAHPASGAAQGVASPQLTTGVLTTEAAKGITDPVGAIRLQRDPNPGGVWFVSPLHWRTPEEIASDGPVEEHPETTPSLTNNDPTRQGPQLGGLVVGALPVDLTTLNRAVDEFFARLEGLGKDAWALSLTGRLPYWVVLALTGSAAFEFARRRRGSSEPSALSADARDSDWDLSTVLALFPPEDAP